MVEYDIIQVKKMLFNVDYDSFQRWPWSYSLLTMILINVNVIIFMVEYDIIQVNMILFIVPPWPVSAFFQYYNMVLKTLCLICSMILISVTYDIITSHVWYYSWSCLILFTVNRLLFNVVCDIIHCHAMILIILLHDRNHR